MNPTRPIIRPSSPGQSYKQGSLTNVTFAQIVEVLGFEPNVADDPGKVRHSWAFTVNDGGNEVHCAIWDWKGSADSNEWSYYGHVVPGLFTKPVGGDNGGTFGAADTARPWERGKSFDHLPDAYPKTTHLVGVKSTPKSTTLLRIPWPGGALRLFSN